MSENKPCCQHCNYPIAKDAQACPHCGSVTPFAPKDYKKEAIEKSWRVVYEIFCWVLTFLFLWYICKEIVSKIW